MSVISQLLKNQFKIPWNVTAVVGATLNILTHIYTVRICLGTFCTLLINVMDVEGKDTHLGEDQLKISGIFTDCSLQIASLIYCENK